MRLIMKTTNVTSPFVAQHRSDVIGVLSGFDRLRLRGTLPTLYQPKVLLRFLFLEKVLLKNFKNFALGLTERIRKAAESFAVRRGRPSLYLNSTKTSKEEVAREIAARDQVRHGLITVLRCVEPCQTYIIRGLQPILTDGKCMHLYFYFQHPVFGFMHLRLQSWFPFRIEVCLNGREWLARQLDRAKESYQRQENYFAWIAHPDKAQRLMDEQLRTPWRTHLQHLLDQCHPLHKAICAPLHWEYYWTCCESEYATDVMFQSPQRLQTLYPHLVQHAMLRFSSADVLRFLGRNVPLTGRSKFIGEVLTDLKSRPEGVRIKHWVKRNSIKMYDKFGRGLRVETTINQCEDFQVYRPAQDKPNEPKTWRAMRRSLGDLPRRAEISKRANERYLLALSAVDEQRPIKDLVGTLCQPIVRRGRRYRALNPWSSQDEALLRAINRGEFALHGLRNRDLRQILYPTRASVREQRRRTARVSRLLALLRAHGILRKVSHTHRYHLTSAGRTLVTALLTAKDTSTQQLTKLAA